MTFSKLKLLAPVLITVIVLASPFVYDPSLFTGDVVYSKELWLTLAIPFCLLFLAARKKLPVSVSWMDVCVLAFWGYAVIRGLFAFGELQNNNYLFILTVSVFCYFLFKTLVTDRASGVAILIWVLGVSAFVLSLFGVLQFFQLIQFSFNSNFKLSVFFVNPALYACYLMACTVVPVYVIKNESQLRGWQWPGGQLLTGLSYATLLLAAFSIPASGSRAALVGLIIACLFLFRHSILKRVNWKLMVLMIAVGLSVLLYFLFQMRPDSANGRLLIWKVSSNIIAKHPLFGVGPGAFKSVYGKAQGAYLNDGANSYYAKVADNTEYAFNELVQMGCELGVVGLLLFGLMLYFALTTNLNIQKAETEALDNRHGAIVELFKALVVSILVFSLFSYPFQSISISVLFYSALGVIATEKRPLQRFNVYTYAPGRVAFLLLALAASYYAVASVGKRSAALENWQLAKRYGFAKDTAALHHFQQAYPSLNSNGVFLAEYGKALLDENAAVAAQDVLNRAAAIRNDYFVFLNLGDACIKNGRDSLGLINYQYAKDMVPNRFFPLYKIMQYYEQKQDLVNAKKMATEILQKDIKVESPAVSEILAKARSVLRQ